jgi:hypothetical protein
MDHRLKCESKIIKLLGDDLDDLEFGNYFLDMTQRHNS